MSEVAMWRQISRVHVAVAVGSASASRRYVCIATARSISLLPRSNVVRSLRACRLCLAACRKERSTIMLEKANPGLDIAGVSDVAVDRELGAEEG